MTGKVLAVFAHPDDETFICGGTLAKTVQNGDEVVLVCATKGEMGRRLGTPPSETRESLAGVRDRELKNACKALGIGAIHFLGLRDKTLEIQPFEDLKNRVLAIMVRERPVSVLTFHQTWGGHPDHCAIGAATTAAFVEYARTAESADLYFVCSGDMIRNPGHYGLRFDQYIEVDVSDCIMAKLSAYRAHGSQSRSIAPLWEDDDSSASTLWSLEYLLHWRTLLPAESWSVEAVDNTSRQWSIRSLSVEVKS